MAQQTTKDVLTRLQEEAKSLIVKYLKESVVSLSSKEEKRTGNAYQSIQLDGQMLQGFRSSERNIYAGINLKGKTVIDLGCNLGEVCRDAARAGAFRVEGIEYEDFFVQMARYVAAYEKLYAVSYRQGDLTKSDTYGGKYDVVSTLSVSTYTQDHMDAVAAMTAEVLIVETHAVKANWEKIYLKPLLDRFAHVALVGISDHKAANKAEARFMLMASQKPLHGILAERARALAGTKNPFTIDASKSVLKHFDAVLDKLGLRKGGTFQEAVETSKAVWPVLDLNALAAEVKQTGLVQSVLYWAAFLHGYSEYKTTGAFTPQNIYYRSLEHLIENKLYDGAFTTLMKNPESAARRLGLRYTMIDAPESKEIDPIILYNMVGPDDASGGLPFKIYMEPANELTFPIAIDGHHRLFVAYLTGARSIPVLPMWYADIPAVQARIKKHPGFEKKLWSEVYAISQKLWR